MKITKLLLTIIAIAFLSGCAKEPVAMNLYTPKGDTEKISGVSVVVTQDMIKATQARMRKSRNIR